MKYLLVIALSIVLFGCGEIKGQKERDELRWKEDWWYKNELRVGRKISDPFKRLEVVEENGKMTKFGCYYDYTFANGVQYEYYRKYITVKDSIIVSIWVRNQ